MLRRSLREGVVGFGLTLASCTPQESPTPPPCVQAEEFRAAQDLVAQEHQQSCGDTCDTACTRCSSLSARAQELAEEAFNAEAACREQGGAPKI